MTLAHAAARPPARDAVAPTRARQLANFVVFEAAWFACILGVAHGEPAWGTAAVGAAIAWHLAISARPATELALIAILGVIGLVAESLVLAQGHVAYPNGQLFAWLAPYWLVALWAELGMALNVTLRWLKRKPLLAAALGALFGPLSFLGGVRLGGARFIDEPAALVTLAIEWALLMPLTMWISDRFDGVATPPDHA